MGLASKMAAGAIQENILFIILLFLAFAYVPAYFAMRWRENKLEKERDVQLGLKSFLYLFQVAAFQVIVLGVFTLIDYVLGLISSGGPAAKQMLGALGALAAAAAVFLGMEFVLAQTNAKERWYPQKVFYGINLFLTLSFGIMGFIGFFEALLSWKSGPAFHVPLARAIVYLPAGLVLAIMQLKVSSPEGPPSTLRGGLLALGGSRMQALSDQAAAGMAQASSSIDAAAQQGGAPQAGQSGSGFSGPAMAGGSPQSAPGAQAAQPVQQQPVAQQPQAPAGGQADPAVCPSCGGQTRFIAQYNRTWCDNCQRYL